MSRSNEQPTSLDAYRFDRPPSIGERVLWFCAGADAQALRFCPHSDRVKYQGLGGVVLATAVLAVLSGSYAFYTVFLPKTDLVLARTDPHGPTFWVALAFGVLWGLVIFNLDRFVVSSAGKGDGEESISFEELRSAFPRMLLAVAIALTISKPLEIRVMESEIEAQLELEQQEYRSKLDNKTEDKFANRKAEMLGDIKKASTEIEEVRAYLEKRRLEIQAQRRLLEQEAAGEVGSGLVGHGPAYRDKRENLETMEAELARDRAEAESRIALMEADRERDKQELASLDARMADEKELNVRQSNNLDGLVKRIQLAHEISPLIGYALMLLFVMIEIAPILFKLMLREGAYDRMVEHLVLMAALKAGIDAVPPAGDPASGQVSKPPAKFLKVEQERAVQQKRVQHERELTEQALDEYRAAQRVKIAEDPGGFVARASTPALAAPSVSSEATTVQVSQPPRGDAESR